MNKKAYRSPLFRVVSVSGPAILAGSEIVNSVTNVRFDENLPDLDEVERIDTEGIL